jgi:Neuraminidase (sialidase)
MAVALSSDGGKTWKPGGNPADDGQTGGHAFIDILADRQGVFHLVWLDTRGPGKGLRYSRSTDGGATWSANVTLDPATCECCWNTLALGPGGQLAVLYRQRSPRDMALITSNDGGSTWGRPATVGEFNWAIDACPHVGGGLAYLSHSLCAAVWTAKDASTHGAYVLNSPDGGRTWSQPEHLGDSGSWHADLASDGAAEVWAVWDAYLDGGQAVFAARSGDGGKNWSSPQRLSEVGASATHPRVVWTPAGFRAFWTQHQEGGDSIWTMRKL